MRCTIFELLFIADIATSFIFHFYTFSHEGQCFDIFPFCYSFFRYFSLSTFFPFDVFSFDIFTLFFSLSTFFLSTFLLHTDCITISIVTQSNLDLYKQYQRLGLLHTDCITISIVTQWIFFTLVSIIMLID